MIDKAEQRRRATELSQQLAAQGQQAPKLTYPVSKPKPAVKFAPPVAPMVNKHKVDSLGQVLAVGNIVVTTVDGIVSVLRKGRIVRFTKDRIEIEVSMGDGTYKKVLKYGEAIAKIQ